MILLTKCNTEFEIDDSDNHLFTNVTFFLNHEYVGVWHKDTKIVKNIHKTLLSDSTQQVDHIDRNPLNNKRINLRYTTHAMNMHNRRSWGQYPKGVTHLSGDRCQARIKINKKSVNLGVFRSIEDAANAYVAAAIEHYGVV